MKKIKKYFKGRIVLKENHCTYESGHTDLAWELSIDEQLVGAIWKLYDEDFYKLVLTSFGDEQIPKYYHVFGSITENKNRHISIQAIIGKLKKSLESYGQKI